MADMIDRQAAIDAIMALSIARDKWISPEGVAEKRGINTALCAICDLPSAQPEQKHGHWKCGDDMFEYAICSSCKWDCGEAWEYAKKNFRFCPNCGAEMEQKDG